MLRQLAFVSILILCTHYIATQAACATETDQFTLPDIPLKDIGSEISAKTLEILGVPKDESWYMAGALSFGYPTGRWGVAARQPAREVSFRNQWGAPAGFVDDGPLWPEA